MKTKLFLILFIISFRSNPIDKLLTFDPRTLHENKIPLSEIADDISYVPLDNGFPLGPIHSNYKITKNSILLSASSTGILEFNRDGKFIRKVGSIGRGPGEYTIYHNFSIDEIMGIIYVRDGSTIKAFSRNGGFLRKISVPESNNNTQTFEFYNSKFFAFNFQAFGDTKFNWVVFDTLSSIITRKPRTIPMFKSGFAGACGTYKYQNNLYYWDTYNDTVFSIQTDFKYKPSFIVSPGEHRAPRAHIPNPVLLKQYLSINNLFETDRFVVIVYFYKEMFLVMISKKNKESFLYNLETEQTSIGANIIGGIENDLDGGSMFLPQNYFEENGREYMVGLINPYKLLIHTKSSEFKNSIPKYPEKKKNLEKLVNSLKETDNPILVMVRLKK